MTGATGQERTGVATDEQQPVDRLFVYGTLREGQAARSIFEDHIVATRRATMPGQIVAFPDGYPALIDGATKA